MSEHENDSVGLGRRKFLTGATLTGAAALGAPLLPAAAQTSADATEPARVPQPNLRAETQPPPADPVTQTSSGGDFMAEVLNDARRSTTSR